MAAMPVTPLAPQAAPMSEGSRLANTFFAPSKTFTDLGRNASWWMPFLLITVFTWIFIYAMDRQVGFEQITRNELTRTGKIEQFDKLAPADRARQMGIAASVTRYISYATPVIALLAFLVMAAVLMATMNVAAGGSVPFKVSLAIVVYASLPAIISAVLGTISLFAGVDPQGFNVRNSVASNPAYFMDPTGSKFLYGMASALDIFVIWSIILMGIGYACNSKVKRSTAIVIIAAWYLIFKLAQSALA